VPVISRSELNHPALSTAGGSALNTSINTIYTTLGDNDNSRYKEFSAVADTTTVEVNHNLGVNLSELTVAIYTGSGTNLTRVFVPESATPAWTIQEKAGDEKVIIEIITPSSGGPHTFAVVVSHVVYDFLKVGGNSGASAIANTRLFIENGATTGITIGTPSNQEGYIHFADPGSNFAGEISYNHTSNSMGFFTDGAVRAVTIDSSQNVGIGVTLPTARLHADRDGALTVVGQQSHTALTVGNSTNGAGNVAQITMGLHNVNAPVAIAAIQNTATTYTNSHLTFSTRSATTDTAPTERMRITSDGNVGIGDTQATARLHADRDGVFTVVGQQSHTALTVGNSTNGSGNVAQITMGLHNVNAPVAIAAVQNNASIYTNSHLTFSTRNLNTDTAPIERMRITSSGNVGIRNTTPEDTHATFYNVAVGALGRIQGKLAEDASGFFSLSHNSYYDSGNNPKYIRASTEASEHKQLDGTHVFKVAVAGTGTITWNTAMTIDNSGNVGIGTDSPVSISTGSGPVLDVQGVVQATDADNSTGRGICMQVLHTETKGAGTTSATFSPPNTGAKANGLVMVNGPGGDGGMTIVIQADDTGTLTVNSILGQSGPLVGASLVKTAADTWQIQGISTTAGDMTIGWIGMT